MVSTVSALNHYTQLAPVRLVADSNQAVTFSNGALNNGVGATLTYASGVLTIDSVVVNLNDYVLFAAQTLGYQNGIYQCTQVGAVGVPAILTRRGDFQSLEQIALGGFVPVYAGTVYAGTVWTVCEPFPAGMGVPVTAGANNIVFASTNAQDISGALLAANNLSDVANAATSLTNLGGLAKANNLSDVASATTALSNLGGVPLAGGTLTGKLTFQKATGTEAAGAVTVNAQSGVITTSALTTASNTSYAITLTNSAISASSVILCSLMGGTNTTRGVVISAIPGTGSAAISLENSGVAAAALNGTVIFGFTVL